MPDRTCSTQPKERAPEARILFLGAGPAMFQDSGGIKNRYDHLSEYFSGDFVTPVLAKDYVALRRYGRFAVHPFRYYGGNSLVRAVSSSLLTLAKSLRLASRCGKYDVVVSPNPLVTGVVALLIGRLTGAKTIVEVNGNFESAFKYGGSTGRRERFIESSKARISRRIIRFVLTRADMVKLVYRKQLGPLRIPDEGRIRTASFANFVPIRSFVDAQGGDGKYILLMGYPWFLKGVDVLIKAFKIVSPSFPQYSLKIVGWCPEGKEYFSGLAGGDEKIQLCEPVEYAEAIGLMANCSLYVLASRTDSSPRVLREAMAARKPIVASNVDGVPDLVIDGYNGLLFPSEDHEDLAIQLRRVLSDAALAGTLAENGFRFVHEHLSEERYVARYRDMVRECRKGGVR